MHGFPGFTVILSLLPGYKYPGGQRRLLVSLHQPKKQSLRSRQQGAATKGVAGLLRPGQRGYFLVFCFSEAATRILSGKVKPRHATLCAPRAWADKQGWKKHSHFEACQITRQVSSLYGQPLDQPKPHLQPFSDGGSGPHPRVAGYFFKYHCLLSSSSHFQGKFFLYVS